MKKQITTYLKYKHIIFNIIFLQNFTSVISNKKKDINEIHLLTNYLSLVEDLIKIFYIDETNQNIMTNLAFNFQHKAVSKDYVYIKFGK